MKLPTRQLWLLLILPCLSPAAYALTAPGPPVAQATPTPSHNYCLLQNGKMMVVKGGKLLPVTEAMTMRDGTICRPDGTCTRPDGTVVQVREGQHMMKNGKQMRNTRFK